MQSIITRYHGPTAKRPGRMSATSTAGIRKWFPYGHDARTDDRQHLDAAKGFAKAMGWTGTYYCGAYNDKGAQIWVKVSGQQDDTFTLEG